MTDQQIAEIVYNATKRALDESNSAKQSTLRALFCEMIRAGEVVLSAFRVAAGVKAKEKR